MTIIKIISSSSSANGYIIESGGQALVLELGCKMMDYTLNMEDFASVRGCIASHW